MWILLSGEGATDIGTKTPDPGPITLGLSQILKDPAWGLGYSFVEYEYYSIVSEKVLSDTAKAKFKSISSTGKKKGKETKYFYKNARALALLAKEKAQSQGVQVMPILFRDADGTVSADRGEWQQKWQSMLDGFTAEGIDWGVPVLPKPKSEAWILCALVRNYQNCGKLEERSGNDDSPNSLKQELADTLGQQVTRDFLNREIKDGRLDFAKIQDMPSFQDCYARLKEAFNILKDKPTSVQADK